jgi:hypothetical protein
MISGRINFDYVLSKDNFIYETELSIEEIEKQDREAPDLNQILLISEKLNQKFKQFHIQPLSYIKFDLFDNITEIHLLLLSNEELSNAQKLDYTKLQRYFMKKYLSEIIKPSNLK